MLVGFSDLADERRNDVRIIEVVLIAGTIQIGWHRRQVVSPILPVIGPAHLDARDLSHRIRSIGRLQWAGKQIFLFDRLGR